MVDLTPGERPFTYHLRRRLRVTMAENHTHYRDYRDVRGDGRIVLYRRADNQGLNWSVRLKIPTTVGYVVKSAKTAGDFEARRFAEEAEHLFRVAPWHVEGIKPTSCLLPSPKPMSLHGGSLRRGSRA